MKKEKSWLSSRQMESLAALCDTFLPSIDISDDATRDVSVVDFFRTSASMAATPQHVAWMTCERVQHPRLPLCRFALWVLSTWIGTFIMCGRTSLSPHFPFFQSFPEISPKKRQEILLSWSNSYFPLLRFLFLGAKIFTLLSFFTQVNDISENLCWKAIGYPGPDPDFMKKRGFKELETDQKSENQGPLHEGLVNLKGPRELVFQRLNQLGFSVSVTGKRSPSVVVKCDALVVGSGSGGGLVAGVLAKAGHKVLVLEKGSYFARSNLSLLEGPSMDQMYLGNGLMATKDLDVILLAGATVGGGSTINWSASIKTPPRVTKEWSETYELKMFETAFYKEAMDVVCQKMGVQSRVDAEGFNSMILRKGCQEMGLPVNDVPQNGPSDHYCGWCCLGCKDGRKKGVSETWLVDLVDSGNGAILPECEAIKLIHKKLDGNERSSAVGVAFTFQNQGRAEETWLVESGVTVVACGALSTPALLKRSGLKNPSIGKNLHIHPVVMGWGYFPDTWPGTEKKSYEGGILTAMSTVVVDDDDENINSTGYGTVIQTPALHPGMFSVLMPWISGIDIKTRMCKFSRTAHIFALARDKGSGIVSPSSVISYDMDASDEENLKKGIEKVLRILAAAGAEEIGTHHRSGKSLKVKEAKLDEFERFVKEESGRGFGKHSAPICSAHQMGSCRMGTDAGSSVVNPTGETWEVEGLYIADSSVLPTAVGVNPMVTIQAVAYCTAHSVLEAMKKKKST